MEGRQSTRCPLTVTARCAAVKIVDKRITTFSGHYALHMLPVLGWQHVDVRHPESHSVLPLTVDDITDII